VADESRISTPPLVLLVSQRFCDECRREAPQLGKPYTGAQRAEQDHIFKLYSCPRWNKGLRPRVLQRYPICVDCKAAPSAVADHNIPARLICSVAKAEKLFLDPWGGFFIMENLVGRCHACHNKKGRTEDIQDWQEELDRVLAPYRKGKQSRGY